MSHEGGYVDRQAVDEMVILIATRDITDVYDGETVTLHAGRDRLVASHELAKRHPDAFRVVGPGDGGSRSSEARFRAMSPRRAPSPSPRSDMTLEEELAIRDAAIASLQREDAQRASRPAPDPTDVFWAGIQRTMEDPRERAEAAASEAMLDQLEAARARTLADEREDIAGWLDS